MYRERNMDRTRYAYAAIEDILVMDVSRTKKPESAPHTVRPRKGYKKSHSFRGDHRARQAVVAGELAGAIIAREVGETLVFRYQKPSSSMITRMGQTLGPSRQGREKTGTKPCRLASLFSLPGNSPGACFRGYRQSRDQSQKTPPYLLEKRIT